MSVGLRPNKTRAPAQRRDDASYWDAVAQRLQKQRHYLAPALARIKRDAYLSLIERWAPGRVHGRVLKTDAFEEAFGEDALVPALSRKAEQVVVAEISPELSALARRRLGETRIRYAAADARRLPFASESFELIVSPSTLDHFTDPADLQRALQELRRVLRPAGRMIVALDNRSNVTYPLLRLAAWCGLVPFYLGRFYTMKEMRAELESAGFSVEAETAIVHNPRLFAVGSMLAARKLGSQRLERLLERFWRWAQTLENSRWRYRTGTFLACLAVRRD